MNFVRNISWQDVFEGWRAREANNPGWIECATKIKGWPDWASWRSFTAQQIDAEHREWKLYAFSDPLREIPEMLIGPYSGWQSKVINKNKTSFKQLLEIPNQYQELSQHDGVLKIMNGLPFETEMIGLIRKDIDKIACIEGHHRATAIALAQMQRQKIDFSETSITIALTELDADDCGLFDILLQRGTSKIA